MYGWRIKKTNLVFCCHFITVKLQLREQRSKLITLPFLATLLTKRKITIISNINPTFTTLHISYCCWSVILFVSRCPSWRVLIMKMFSRLCLNISTSFLGSGFCCPARADCLPAAVKRRVLVWVTLRWDICRRLVLMSLGTARRGVPVPAPRDCCPSLVPNPGTGRWWRERDQLVSMRGSEFFLWVYSRSSRPLYLALTIPCLLRDLPAVFGSTSVLWQLSCWSVSLMPRSRASVQTPCFRTSLITYLYLGNIW